VKKIVGIGLKRIEFKIGDILYDSMRDMIVEVTAFTDEGHVTVVEYVVNSRGGKRYTSEWMAFQYFKKLGSVL
jgi:hypothetical protein